MKIAGSPINEPRYISLDLRDWERMRDRVAFLEDAEQTNRNRIEALELEVRRLTQQEALFMNGTKERLDVFGLLLAGFEARLVGKDVG
jgi:hypothetical protein